MKTNRYIKQNIKKTHKNKTIFIVKYSEWFFSDCFIQTNCRCKFVLEFY